MLITITETYNNTFQIEVEAESIQDAKRRNKTGEYNAKWERAKGHGGDRNYTSYEDENGNILEYYE